MALRAFPEHTAKLPTSAKPLSQTQIETIPPAPAPERREPLSFEDGKLPSPQDSALDYIARQHERAARRRRKQEAR